jgi:hypothetical protein
VAYRKYIGLLSFDRGVISEGAVPRPVKHVNLSGDVRSSGTVVTAIVPENNPGRTGVSAAADI